MSFMIFNRVGVYKYIVKIYPNKYSYMFTEYPGHQSLERRGGVTIALLHDMRYKRSQRRCKGCLPDILCFHSYLLVGVGHIDFCSIFSSGYVHANLILVWEWGHVFIRVIIPLSRINYSPSFSTLLWDAKKR